MNVGVFSEFRTNPVYSSTVAASTTSNKTSIQAEKKKKVIETAKTVAPIAISIAAIPVTALIATKITTSKVAGLNNNLVNDL